MERRYAGVAIVIVAELGFDAATGKGAIDTGLILD